MNILILGHGGREHAIVESVRKSKYATNLYILNGNPGMERDAISLKGPEEANDILNICLKHHIDFVIPGGETYLSNGVVDCLSSKNISCFGPTKQASLIESSKIYAKQIMQTYDIPTAKYQKFYTSKSALSYLDSLTPPYVIKYDGLALGKGVTVTTDKHEAELVITDLLENHIYGNDGILIEEFLHGKEYSMIALVHHNTVLPLPIARDHKPRFDGNKGPNTGGMGAYSPVDFISEQTYQASYEILKKCAKGMFNENNPFTGFLYGGFILTEEGPKIIEFNCRLGDPEAEVILPRIQNDFIELLLSVLLDNPIQIKIDSLYHVGVVMVAKGYPNSYPKGCLITYDPSLEKDLFHMGTSKKNDSLISHGGRVLLIKGKGKDLHKAHCDAYQKIKKISCDCLDYRHDIGAFDL